MPSGRALGNQVGDLGVSGLGFVEPGYQTIVPDSFGNFFDAIYWATVSLTTVGYGDIYPVTVIGRIVTMISSIFGIAIIALPSGIITAGFMDELNSNIAHDNDESMDNNSVNDI